MKQETKERILNLIMLGGLLLICLAIGIASQEFYEAGKFCDSVNGTSSFKIMQVQHLCDGKVITKGTMFGEKSWWFEEDILNFNSFKLE